MPSQTQSDIIATLSSCALSDIDAVLTPGECNVMLAFVDDAARNLSDLEALRDELAELRARVAGSEIASAMKAGDTNRTDSLMREATDGRLGISAASSKYDACLNDLVRQVALMMDDCEERADGSITIDCDISQGFLRRIYDLLSALEDAGYDVIEPAAPVPEDVAKDAVRAQRIADDLCVICGGPHHDAAILAAKEKGQ